MSIAKLSGFNLIITTPSAHDENYCRAAGATHVIDNRATPYASIPAVVKEITKGPVGIILEAI
jgi:NADPH:quinone reductase-like Zn-dependent oxidoreductase